MTSHHADKLATNILLEKMQQKTYEPTIPYKNKIIHFSFLFIPAFFAILFVLYHSIAAAATAPTKMAKASQKRLFSKTIIITTAKTENGSNIKIMNIWITEWETQWEVDAWAHCFFFCSLVFYVRSSHTATHMCCFFVAFRFFFACSRSVLAVKCFWCFELVKNCILESFKKKNSLYVGYAAVFDTIFRFIYTFDNGIIHFLFSVFCRHSRNSFNL